MGAEILLYSYGLVCLSMLAFNLLYSLYLRGGDRRLLARVDVIRRQVDGQLQQIREHPDETSHPLQAEHLTWMRRHLSRVNYLLAFDHLLEDMDEREPACRIYIKQLQPVLLPSRP